MKAIKNALIELFFLFFVFAGTIVLYLFMTYEDTKKPAESFTQATLPVITMQYGEYKINTLHGYTSQMQGQYMLGAVTPYQKEEEVSVCIEKYANVIGGISYEVRSADTKRLIDAQEIKEWTTDESRLYARVKMSGIMEPEEEYLFVLKLVTETHGQVYYYVRLKNVEENDIQNQLAFVTDFSSLTLEKKATDKYGAYLEYDASQDHSNLAYVDIKSSYENIEWGNLQVTRVTEPELTIQEVLGNIGCYRIAYKVMAKDEYGTEQYYHVTEYFRLRTLANAMYLDVYERHANQIFIPGTQSVSTTRINLGLDDDGQIHYKTSPAGGYVSFVKESALYMLDMEKNKLTEIFSFDSLTNENEKIEKNQYDIEILTTEKTGNIMFMVYGYMAKGAHEGQVGVGLYQYDYEKDRVDELVFVPSDRPFDVFKDSVGKFAYMTEDDLLYFMVGNSIYTVTMDSNEYMQLVTGLTSGNYIINEYNNILAWHENASIYDADTIRVIDVDAKKDYEIKAEEGDRIKVIGFIGNDLVYGTAHTADITQDAQGNTIFPMYKINVAIYDQEEKESSRVESYQKDNIYITNVEIQENVMTLQRVAKDETGAYYAVEDDKYVNRKGEDRKLVEVETIITELKKTEVVLKLAYTITSTEKFQAVRTEEINFVTANSLNLNQSEYVTDKYYVYGAKGLEKIFGNARDAVNYANEIFGTVVEDDGNFFWGRINKPNLAKLTDTGKIVAGAYTTFEQLQASGDYNVTDLSGVEFATLLYFAAYDIPVVTYMEPYGLVILSAYSGYQGNIDTFAFTLCSTGEIIKMPYNDAKAAMEGSGAQYYVLVKVS